jgi:uncharacterized short protein YbdD (DUF466 family)
VRLRHLYGLVRWYLRELTGEAAYDRYLDRHRHAHPGVLALPRRDFERVRTDRGDDNPGARCC